MRSTITRICLLFATFTAVVSLSAQTPLKDIADQKKVYVGNIISNQHLDNPAGFNGGRADANLRGEYNAAVLENYMKMSFVLPFREPANIHELTVDQLRGQLRTSQMETFLSRSGWQGLRKRGHAMIWFSQAPAWLNNSAPSWTAEQVFDFSRKYILALGQVAGDRIEEWDVINEAISDNFPATWRPGTWYRKANDGSETSWGTATYENYIKMLFVWAREAQPNSRLYYNDYSIERFGSSTNSKNGFMRSKFKALRACGAPVDGIGFQSHFVLSNLVSSTGAMNTSFLRSVRQTMEDLDAAGLDVAITELDIRICNNGRPEAFQETAFREFVAMALSQPNCRELLFWGLRDEDNWITLTNNPPFNGCQDAAIFEGNYVPKAAYNGVVDALNGLPDRDEYGFAELVAGDAGPADCGGEPDLGGDAILAVVAPDIVRQGETVNVEVTYESATNRDIVIYFQYDRNPYTVFQEARLAVTQGEGTVSIPVAIPNDVPIAADDYQFQTLIATTGGGWNERISNIEKTDIDVVSGATSITSPGGDQFVASAFPNPTDGRVKLALRSAPVVTDYVVFNATGQLVQQGQAPIGVTDLSLILADVPAGLYTVVLQRGGRSNVVRVVRL
ncbi:endo-1,4-beta-xylanase [Lewinella sp. 4G2]|uniref:endo-1,4-beta-xylanase n=1 Tax=Lewinella sp. 4G2 TaxID=1803372 RepID=UPI0018D2792E|nr:endo-1,4-beta-xylanase [Lewinella sp. 4G2]